MLSMSNARRRIMKERAEAGDFGDPRAEARAARAKAPTATSTADGRPVAPPSKRYTPPKAAKTTIRKR